MHQCIRVCRWLAAIALLAGVTVCTASAGHADTADGDDDYLAGSVPPAETLAPLPPTPYPDSGLILRSFDQRQPDEFFTASNEGVWFSTPLGLNCGIWDRGSFGCTGDIRGAPPGTSHIGWINGNMVTRYDAFDPVLSFQFPPGHPEQILSPRSYVDYNGTRCATMTDSSTYCARGKFQFFITPTHTWLSPP